MLVISFALHLSLALGIAFSFFDPHFMRETLSPDTKTTLTLVPSQVSTALPQAAPSGRSTRALAANPGQISAPSATAHSNDVRVANDKSASAFATEGNPNANVPQPKIDSLLCPVPPPVLNSKDGMVFLLDISGSMYEPYAGSTRLALARQALARRIHALKDGTPFAVAVYAQAGRRSGPLVVANNATREAAVRFIMQDFDCGGGTNLAGGLAMVQELHAGQIVLASDGDLNTSPRDLLCNADRILDSENHAPALTIVGVGPRPSTNAESILQSLAEQEGGKYLTVQSNDSPELLTSTKTEASGP